MALILYFLIIIANAICVFLKKNVKLVSVLSIVLLALFVGFSSSDGGDALMYKTDYYRTEYNIEFEIGYKWLSKLAMNSGLSFDIFRLFVFIIGSILMFFGGRSITKNSNIVILLLTISVYYFLAVLIRFYISISILVFSLRYVKRKNIIGFLICVFVAFLFHKSALFSLVLLFAFLPVSIFKMVEGILKPICILFAFSCVLFFAFPSLLVFFQNKVFALSNVVLGNNYEVLTDRYFSNGYSRKTIIYIIAFVVEYIIVFGLNKGYVKEVKDTQPFIISSVINNFLLLITPLLLISNTMIRFYSFGLIYNAFFYSRILSQVGGKSIKMYKTKVDRHLFLTSVIFVSFIWFFAIYVRHDLSYDIYGYLQNNSLLG